MKASPLGFLGLTVAMSIWKVRVTKSHLFDSVSISSRPQTMNYIVHEIDLILAVRRRRKGLLSVRIHSRVIDHHSHQVLMGDEQMSVLGISILRAIPLEEELGKRTTFGGLRVGRNVDWSSCGHFWCIYWD
jgi:hypothetical protein